MRRTLVETIALSERMADDLENDDSEPTIGPEESVLRAAVRRRAMAEADIARAVGRAREAGLSWREVGDAVGTTPQAAHERYAGITRQRAEQAPKG